MDVVVPRAAFEAFQREYGSQHQLTEELGVHPRRLKKQLTDKGMQPALDKAMFHATFYLRAEVERILGPSSGT
jgi:hypothetical protein